MTKNIISRIAAGMVMATLAIALVFSIPHSAQAGYNYGYNNSYNCGCNSGYGYGYGYTYPPAPTYYNTPSVQVTYGNGYYQNYFVPTVKYFPAPAPTPVYTNYYPGYNNNYGYNNYGGFRHW